MFVARGSPFDFVVQIRFSMANRSRSPPRLPPHLPSTTVLILGRTRPATADEWNRVCAGVRARRMMQNAGRETPSLVIEIHPPFLNYIMTRDSRGRWRLVAFQLFLGPTPLAAAAA